MVYLRTPRYKVPRVLLPPVKIPKGTVSPLVKWGGAKIPGQGIFTGG